MKAKNFHFVLVHGATAGAWCWYNVADLLTQAGHTVSSLDNASAGIDPRDADNITSLEEYNQPLTDFFTALPAEDKDLTLFGSLEKKSPLWQEPLLYTSKNYGSVGRVYIVAKDDKLIVEEFQRKMIAENPPQMVYEIEGADHTVFFSKTLRLADLLIEIANTS